MAAKKVVDPAELAPSADPIVSEASAENAAAEVKKTWRFVANSNPGAEVKIEKKVVATFNRTELITEDLAIAQYLFDHGAEIAAVPDFQERPE
jgi:hypothetical protein